MVVVAIFAELSGPLLNSGLIIGLVSTYSTIGIASPVVVWWRSYRDTPVSEKKKSKSEAGADARV